MRKITSETVDCFLNYRKLSKGNMTVTVHNYPDFTEVAMRLHGNLIAVKNTRGEYYISTAGWKSRTTKERLNGLPSVFIYQKRGKWFLNGKEWNGLCIDPRTVL